MNRKANLCILAFTLLAAFFAIQCGSGEAEVNESADAEPSYNAAADFEETMDLYNKATSDEEKHQLWFDFLERNPGGNYTEGTIAYLVDSYYMDKNDDPEGALDFIRASLTDIDDEALRAECKLLMFGVYGQSKDAEGLQELAAEYEAAGDLSLDTHKAIINAASSAGAWQVVRDHGTMMMEKSTLERIKAEYADNNYSDEEAGKRVRAIKMTALENVGRSSTELGELDHALATFTQGEEYASYSYSGVQYHSLNLYWAEALLQAEDYKACMEKIAADAIIGGDDDAFEIFKQAYLADGGQQSALDDYVESVRHDIARTMPQFSAYDYDGNKVDYDSLKGKVTLLAFWFPT